MFEKITPEQAGISSDNVAKLISVMERRGAVTHGILMMKDGKIFAEEYWKPFHKDFCHRMYSQTKSFVGVAIGLLIEEGKLSLNDKVADYFPEKIDGELKGYVKDQTVKDMLTMCTAGGPNHWWFTSGDPDRTHLYFNDRGTGRPSGTYWVYDSAGSQVLCNLVEKLSGKKMLDYMKEKLFNHMGTFQTATILETPNGVSWGDSAMVCTLRDIASFGQLVMNYGVWEGKRLMNEAYLREATSKVVDNRENAHYHVYYQGYGYQIWRVESNGFAFVGMGDQITLCYPDKNLLFAFNSDNQGTDVPRSLIIGAFEDLIVDHIKDTPLPENKAAQKRYAKVTKDLKLFAVQGEEDSPFRKELQRKVYRCEPNKMGIKKFSFRFKNAKTGEFHYTNEQGDKVIPFGVNHNVFGKFPQLGYANDRGAVATTDGYMHNDAVSFAWAEEKKIILYVQVIDRYFGNMSAVFAFKGDDVAVRFSKTAEHFFMEYEGSLVGHRARKSKK
ncbi:MAG: serine hydrolase [Clostridia bacterium]|nr:serine hydrolase [Clostridia bacterium]